eukprot:5758551-Pleurochrysis_carterae.AAC.1
MPALAVAADDDGDVVLHALPQPGAARVVHQQHLHRRRVATENRGVGARDAAIRVVESGAFARPGPAASASQAIRSVGHSRIAGERRRGKMFAPRKGREALEPKSKGLLAPFRANGACFEVGEARGE